MEGGAMIPTLRSELVAERRREVEVAAARHRVNDAAAERPSIDSPRRRLPRRLISAAQVVLGPAGIPFEVSQR
jgi:hypothetical protein